MQFSVVIPIYNRKSLIRRALESVLNQTVAPREIIVVNDGSTDGVNEMLRTAYPEVTVLNQNRRGVSAARNVGIHAAQFEWIAFLDSDDEWLPTKLERQARLLTDNPSLRICHCDEIWIRNGVRVNEKKRHAKRGGWIFEDCLPLCVISPSAVAIHSTVFSDMGVFDENLPVCEDYDLWLRITQKYPVGFVSERLVVKYGGHEDQLSRTTPAMDRFRIAALLKLLDQDVLPANRREKVLETLVEKLGIYLNGARKRGRLDEVRTYEPILARLER